MEEARSCASQTTTTAVGTRRRHETMSSRAKKDCLSFFVSLKEGFQYVKASIVGQAKKLTARNEREATEADLKAAKMQVEAADAAEDAKSRLQKSA
ncbi:hypothetical protein TorRG33x02_184470 [Trema orientale]|uniref:Uncharacterized protein n=1 Tax=Trema orientale TaxID=63057 RepID=A0A2P5EJI8_TREOI|nr:hypothetical protein TorRG33x02_184470 [Trema orientale]